MSQQIQDLKRRIKSISSTEHITNAMRLVSASKLRKAKANFDNTREYVHYVTDSIIEIFQNAEEVPADYLLENREIKTSCYVMITSCSGLCGSYNGNVIREVEREIKEANDNTKIVAIGTRGKEYFQRRGYDVIESYDGPAEKVTSLETHEISKPLLEKYKSGEIDEIVLVYTSYVNTLKQEVKTVRLLPFDTSMRDVGNVHKKEVEYEPSLDEVFNYLVPKYFEIMIYGAMIEAATCEHASRRSAMDSATDSADEMLEKFSVYFNRARQAAITNQIIEIVAGAEAQN